MPETIILFNNRALRFVELQMQAAGTVGRTLTGGANILNGVQKAVSSNLIVPAILFPTTDNANYQKLSNAIPENEEAASR